MEIGKIIVSHGRRLTLEEAEEIKNKIGQKDVIVKVDADLFEKELDDATEGKESDDIVG